MGSELRRVEGHCLTVGAVGPRRAAAAVGAEYEATLSAAARRAGAHYTDVDVARGLVEVALDAWGESRVPSVVDPTCGGGAFLVAAADALVARGIPAGEVLSAITGVDLDPGAVATSNRAMAHWAAEHGCAPRNVARSGDALEIDPTQRWDLVVGNPPFGSQMRQRTARDPQRRSLVAERFGAVARGTVDDAVVHAVAASTHLTPGGVMCLVLPRSTASASGAAAARQELSARGLVGIWDPGARVFDAGVEVIAAVIRAGGHPGAVRTYTGRVATAAAAFEREDGADPQWSRVVAQIAGVPAPPPASSGAGVVGDVAACAADFRQHYYALVGSVGDERPTRGARLVTSGAVRVGEVAWGSTTIRFAKERFAQPWVDLDHFVTRNPEFAEWLDARLVPKLLVAPQGEVLRVAADHRGDMVPVTPLISVTAHGESTSMLLAALLSPAASAWCLAMGAGSGMSRRAFRPTARMIAEVPLPPSRPEWEAAAAMLDEPIVAWDEFGERMDAAYGGAAGQWCGWWRDRRLK